MKLGCTFYHCEGGNNLGFHKNEENVPIIIHDLRSIDLFNGLFNNTEGKLFFILTHSEQGVCLGVIKQLQGDRNPFKVAWIHVHNTIINHPTIEDGISSIVEAIKKLLYSQGRMDYTELEQLLDSKDYPEHLPCKMNVCDTDNFAVKLFDKGDAFKDLLSQLYQPDLFHRYKAIFFVEEDCGITFDPRVNELSDNDFKSYILVNQSIIKGKLNIKDKNITICDKNNAPLQDFWQEKSKPYDVILKKEFFDPLSIRISEDSRMNSPIQFVKSFSKKDFKVTGENGSELQNFSIEYKGKRIQKIEERDFSDPKCSITISCQGYKSKSIKLQEALSSTPIPVTLEKEPKLYEFIIDEKGKKGELSIQTTENISTEFVPIPGYVIDEDSMSLNNKVNNNQQIKLKYDRTAFLNSWLFIVVAIFVILLAGGAGCFIGANWFAKETPIETTDNLDINSRTPSRDSNTTKNLDNKQMKPCEYLDSKSQWNRTEMEKIAELKGFWDALNKYNFTAIRSYDSRLLNSNKYKEILSKIPTDADTPTGAFCSDGDDISPDNYCEKLLQLTAANISSKTQEGPTNKTQKSPHDNDKKDNHEKQSGRKFGELQ